jgi:hypothetical protein
MKHIKWFAGFFEDQTGKASRKAAALYICLFMLGDIVMKEKTPDLYVLILLGVVALFCLGAITREKVGEIMDKMPTEKKP